jgi:hypothetical protein
MNCGSRLTPQYTESSVVVQGGEFRSITGEFAAHHKHRLVAWRRWCGR